MLSSTIPVRLLFLTSQFYINGLTKPYRLDRNRNDGGVLIYIHEDIPNKELRNHLSNDIEGIFTELNFEKLIDCFLDVIIHHHIQIIIFSTILRNI